MLVRASRDGDLEVVLRLLYTNPFIDGQEQQLRNALWEAVRCKRLEVLRSLLEFRVDPASSPSPDLSRPPASLQSTPWTPLLALAVDGCEKRAEIVAELVCRRGAGGVTAPVVTPATPSAAPFVTVRPPGAVARPGFPRDASPSSGITVAAALLTPTCTPRGGRSKAAAEEAEEANPEDIFTTVPRGGHQLPGKASKHLVNAMRRSPVPRGAEGGASPGGVAGGYQSLGSAGSAGASATIVTAPREAAIHCSMDAATCKEFELLAALLGQSGQAQEARLQALGDDALATLETRLEATLRVVRSHRQQQWEQQLMSVQRRHAEEYRERQSLEDEQACVVCSEQRKSVLFMPCRHLCTCEHCAVKLSACPICRAPIEDSVKCIKP
mmetsp:Transcript_126399/g.223914  ORF Transcript_126399/g.223914 Transcript_126399/m.223914 type:complete len:383 (-) Transcript_126399:63-1211(-)